MNAYELGKTRNVCSDKFCPDCGEKTLRLIETTKPEENGDYKEVRTCDNCKGVVFIARYS